MKNFFFKRDENDEGKGLCVLMLTQFNDFRGRDNSFKKQSGRKSK